MKTKILVTGAAGFIGHHLCRDLKKQGNYVRGVDWVNEEYKDCTDEFIRLDLRNYNSCKKAVSGMDKAYLLAADMGGMGFIQDPDNQASILYNNTQVNFNSLEACRKEGIKNVLYTSSACIYPNYKQKNVDIPALKESNAYPADPQDTYGWEKLQMEHLCKAYRSYGMDIKVARLHNIYGIEGVFDGGREKAPAAFCRKVIEAKRDNKKYVDMWGDGKQTRSFCYIDDCVKALQLIMNSDLDYPINLGRQDMISMNNMMDIVMNLDNGTFKLDINHIKGPEGVRGRDSDNTLFQKEFGWQPEISMKTGLDKTYRWIKRNINNGK